MKRSSQVYYTRVAEKDLGKIPKVIVFRILKKIADNASQPDVLLRAKALTGQFLGAYRYRVGEYRVIFIVDNKGNMVILTVLSIKHRKDIYK